MPVRWLWSHRSLPKSGLRGEVDLGKPRWLPKPSAVNIQGLASFDPKKLSKRLGTVTEGQMLEVKAALRDLLAL